MSFGAVTYGRQVLMGATIGAGFNDKDWQWDRAALVDVNGDGINEVIVSAADRATGGGNDRPVAKSLLALGFDGSKLVDITAQVFPAQVQTYLLRNFVTADFNGDGLKDLFLNNHGTEGVDPLPGEQNGLLLTDGRGHLINATANLPRITDFSHGSLAADFDRDGDVDIFVNNLGDDEPSTSYLLLNDGTGKFAPPSFMVGTPLGPRGANFTASFEGNIGAPYNPGLLDVNNDGNIDIYYGGVYNYDSDTPTLQGAAYMRNNGAGVFELTYAPVFLAPLNSPAVDSSVEFAQSGDMDNDGDLDLLLYWVMYEPRRGTVFQFLRNDGAAGYVDASAQIQGQAGGTMLEASLGANFQLVDADIDGDLDIISSVWNDNFTAQVTFTFMNDGRGNFSRVPGSEFPASQAFIMGDVNGDWIPDAVYGVLDYRLGTPGASGVVTGAVRIGEITRAVDRTGWETNDRIAGGTAADRLSGMGGNDSLNGNAGNDVLIGGAGNDVMIGGAGNDRLEGTVGVDTAAYSGARSSYQMTGSGGARQVTDIRGGSPEGKDDLVEIDRVAFADGVLALDTGVGQNAGMSYRIYQAAFDRIPDAGGLKFWLGQIDSGSSLQRVGQGFIASQEFKNVYGANATNAEFIDRLYDNVLGRDGEAGGVAFWIGQLDDGKMDRATVLAGFAESAENVALVGSAISDGVWLPV